MTLSYDDIFSDFLGRIEDNKLASLDISEATMLISEYLHKGLSQTYIRRLYKTISLDDEIQMIEYEMNYAIDDEQDLQFTKNILSKAMVVEWLEPMVKKTSLLHQHIMTNKESKWFSQKDHLHELRSMLDELRVEIRKEIRDRGYIYNSYLD